KWFEQRFSAWSESKAWFAAILVVLFAYSVMSGQLIIWLSALVTSAMGVSGQAGAAAASFNSHVIYWLINGASLVVATVALAYESYPTHLILGPKGMRLQWKRLLFERTGPVFPWSSVSRIYLQRDGGKTTTQDSW